MAKLSTLEDLFLDEIQDLYDAEKQLTKALPKMAKAATSEELRQAFEDHLDQTRGHVERLEQVFEALGETAKGRKCEAMAGLVKEGDEIASNLSLIHISSDPPRRPCRTSRPGCPSSHRAQSAGNPS